MSSSAMTGRAYDELSRSERRWVLITTTVRSVASVTLLTIAYYVVPLDRALDAGTAVRFVLGLLLVAGVLGWGVRAVLTSGTPRLRVIRAVAAGLPALLLVFAATYVLISQNAPGSFSEPLDRTDALYFTVTVFATVGFGDIAPVDEVARVITTIQMVVNLIAVGVIAKVLFGAADLAVQRRARGDEPSRPAP